MTLKRTRPGLVCYLRVKVMGSVQLPTLTPGTLADVVLCDANGNELEEGRIYVDEKYLQLLSAVQRDEQQKHQAARGRSGLRDEPPGPVRNRPDPPEDRGGEGEPRWD